MNLRKVLEESGLNIFEMFYIVLVLLVIIIILIILYPFILIYEKTRSILYNMFKHTTEELVKDIIYINEHHIDIYDFEDKVIDTCTDIIDYRFSSYKARLLAEQILEEYNVQDDKDKFKANTIKLCTEAMQEQ